MNEYRIISVMKMNGKSVVALDHMREVADLNKTSVIIDGVSYSFSLTHNDFSIIVDTDDDINNKVLHFE